jgi:PPOX class probable F420-dependent enzyme
MLASLPSFPAQSFWRSRAGNSNRGESVASIPEKYKDLLTEKKTFAHLVTMQADGTPQTTPVWIDATDERVLVNTARGRVKDRNMSANPVVALSIVDPDNPYRYVEIRGRVVASREEGAAEHIDKMAKKYLGQDKYPFAQPGEKRVIFEIEPKSFHGMGS